MFRRTSLAGLFVVVALAAAACGDSSSGGGGTSARGVTSSEIAIGAISTTSNWPGVGDGAKARFDRANKEGGVNGRKIKFLGERDDGNDPTRNLDIAKSLVQSDKVFAMLNVSTALLPATSDFLEQEKVPYIGWGFMPGYCGSKYGFGLNGCLNGPAFKTPGAEANLSLTEPIIKASGKKAADLKVALQCGDDPGGKPGCVQFQFLFEKAGAKVVYNKQDMTQPGPAKDFTPYVSAIMATNPDIVFYGVDFANTVGLASALKAAGFKGLGQSFITYIPGVLETSADLAKSLDGSYANSQFPPQEENTAAITQALADLTASGAKPNFTQGVQLGYWSADILLQMLKAVGSNLTPTSFEAKINGGFKYQPPAGGMGPVSFPGDHVKPTPCAALVKIANAKFEVVSPFACYSSIPFTG
jgi:branched-chain amino acid transport system substrate-binding protein